MLVAIGLVYLILVILFASLLGPLVIFSPRPLSIIGAFVVVVTGGGLDLSALIAMLISIVVTSVIVLRDLAVGTNAIVLRCRRRAAAGSGPGATIVTANRAPPRPAVTEHSGAPVPRKWSYLVHLL